MKKKNPLILLAEDVTFLADMMKLALEPHGVTVDIVTNGREAIEAMKKKKYDMLLLDILMPEVDGYGVLEHMKEKNTQIPTIIVSNISSGEDRRRCKALGCKAYIVKSDIDDNGLWAAISPHLRLKE